MSEISESNLGTHIYQLNNGLQLFHNYFKLHTALLWSEQVMNLILLPVIVVIQASQHLNRR